MVELNEGCLHTIFGFLTPVEWIQISEVCQLWKTVVDRQWQKFEKIDICDYELCRTFKYKLINSFSARDAEKFVRHVAKFCKNFLAFTMENSDSAIMSGQTYYRMGGLGINRLLQLLAENSAKIERADFMVHPKPEMLKLLFENNKIKDLKVFHCSYAFWLHIPTDGIETLWVQLENIDSDTISFKGHFPNLQKLDLGFRTNYSGVHYYQQILQRTLPYVLGIKSLTLSFEAYKLPVLPVMILEEVAKLPYLEELSFVFDHRSLFAKSDDYPEFKNKIDVPTFSKLRDLKIKNFRVPENVLKSMLLLPNLEKLDVDLAVQGFRSIDNLPKMSKLSYLAIKFEKPRAVDLKNLFKVVKKMPNLEVLCIKGITQMQFPMITDKGMNVARALGKVFALERLDHEEDDNEKYELVVEIGRKTEDEPDTTPVFHFRFDFAE